MRHAWIIAKYTLSLFIRRGWIALFLLAGFIDLFPAVRWAIETSASGGLSALFRSEEFEWHLIGAQETMEALSVMSALVCGFVAVYQEDRASTLDLFLVRPAARSALFLGKAMGTLLLVTLISIGTSIAGLLLAMATGADVGSLFWLTILHRVSQAYLVNGLALLGGASRNILVAGALLILLGITEAHAVAPSALDTGSTYWARVVISLLLPAPNPPEPFLVGLTASPVPMPPGHHLAVFFDNFLYSALLVLLGAELFARRVARSR